MNILITGNSAVQRNEFNNYGGQMIFVAETYHPMELAASLDSNLIGHELSELSVGEKVADVTCNEVSSFEKFATYSP